MALRRAGWFVRSRSRWAPGRSRFRCSSSASAKASTTCSRSSQPNSPRRWLISFSSVCKRYPGGKDALLDVSLGIEAGAFVLVAGPSGAGKSTLLKLIATIDRPTSGTVVINGQNVGALRRAALPYLRRNLGLVFQDQKLLYDRSVYDNVMLPLAFGDLNVREAGRRARAALEKVGLLAREKANPVQLSGGEQQRLAIARAVVNRPSVLIADEPTANLDAASAAAILDIFADFNKVGVTVLVATHDEALIGRFARRVLRLAGGRLVE